MELRVLRYFLAVAREGSVTGAANFLHVTQPTLSRQIKDLEEELGTKLFVRHSHSVSLTPDGMRLRKRAEEVVDMIEKTEAEFAVKEESVEGDVHIGAGETRVMRHVAEVIHELRKDYPNIHIHLFSGNLEDVAERLDKGLLDFGVLIQPADLSKYDYVNLPEKDVWGVVTRKDSPLAARQAITRQDLLGEPLILSRQAIRRTSAKNEFIEWFKDDFEKLENRIKELGMRADDYKYYMDLRKYGSTRHAGFGLGFERCVMYLTGMSNIRDVLPYPRTVGTLI